MDLPGTAAICPSCDAPLRGQYCSSCGEERFEGERLRFSHLIRDAVEEVTDFEHSRLLGTFGALLFHPGRLTSAYLAGARKRYLGPVKLFIFAFAISLLAYSVLPRTSSYDVRKFIRNDRTGSYEKIISQLSTKRGVPRDTLVTDINERWRRYLTYGEMGYPLGVAVALWLVYSNRRRYFGEHMIFALHYVTFGLLTAVLLWPAYYLTGVDPSRSFALAAVLNSLIVGVYLVIALRRVYGDRVAPAVARAVVIMVTYFVCASVVIVAALTIAFIFAGRSG